jgi:hypothetical protein
MVIIFLNEYCPDIHFVFIANTDFPQWLAAEDMGGILNIQHHHEHKG